MKKTIDIDHFKIKLYEFLDEYLATHGETPGTAPDPPPPTGAEPIGSYRFGESDAEGHHGEFYFIVKGPNKSLTIGGKPYEYERLYQGEELWYGKGHGEIRLVASDGTIYVGDTGTEADNGDGAENYPFHHTTTASSDGGKSLVLCPGDNMEFDKVWCGRHTIPRHNDDNGRHTWWNGRRGAEPDGDIFAKKGNKVYRFPASRKDRGIVYGSCR